MITMASYNMDGTITVIIDEVEMAIPNDIENRHRAMLAEWEADGNVIAPYAEPTLTPEEKRERMPRLTARQLRLGLLHLGKLAEVPVAIAALSEPERSQAQIEWDFASEFHRLHPLIVKLIPILGLIDDQVDPVWESHYLV
jgi:hypothetical protein